MRLFCTSCQRPFDTDIVDMTCKECKMTAREEALMSQVSRLQGTVAAKDAELGKYKRGAHTLNTQVAEQTELISRLNTELEESHKR